MTARITAILQARTGSRRLPGKVLQDVAGKPMLEREIERVKAARRVDEIILATTDLPEDRPLLSLAERTGIIGFAGDSDDVLDRYYRAARSRRAETIVRLTGDCPLIDPSTIDSTIELWESSGADYASTGDYLPDGLDTEVFSFAALAAAWREAALASEREHVTPFIWKNPDRFSLAAPRPREGLAGMRWTVDEPRDLEFVRAVYARLHREGEPFGMEDVLALLKREPELMRINEGISRNEGYARSLAEEASREDRER